MVSNFVLRQNAQRQLGETPFQKKWLSMLVICGILPIIFLSMSSILYIGPVVLLLVSGPLLFGMAWATIACIEGEKCRVRYAFYGFSGCFGAAVLLEFSRQAILLLWSLLLLIPGVVKSYSYALAFYLLQEDKTKEPMEYLKESRRMMNGYKWQLFCLDCSFLGWYLVGLLCMGVGVFFVIPYHQMARANFYEALKAEKPNEEICIDCYLSGKRVCNCKHK